MRPPRIAILGNCQATTIYRIFKLLAPSVQVTRYLFTDLQARLPTKEHLFAAFEDFDMIFSQPFGPGLHPDVDGLALKNKFADRCCFYPGVDFSAFHPDCVYIWRHYGSEALSSPIGDYHSALTFLAYSLGLAAEAAIDLFNAEVFEQLGYFQFWDVSESVLIQQCRAIDFPIEGIYRSWVRRGCFMHSINHPKLFVLADIARTLLKILSSPSNCCDVEEYLPDESLFDAVWPLYPEIVAAMGLQGAYIFKHGSRSDDENPFLSLHAFVKRSYELYKGAGAGPIGCPRVEEWIKRGELVEYIRKCGGK